jgi:hypothetical protein
MEPLNTTIHFLANTQVGKTSFTAGMHARFKLRPEDFRLYTVDAHHKPDHDRDLDLREIWQNIAEKGVYPDRTVNDTMRKYHFELHHSGEPIIRFDWLDYRGEVLGSRSTAGDFDAFSRQVDNTLGTGCLFYGISAEHLITPIENDDGRLEEVRAKAWIDRMDQLTKDARSTPAVIVVTKADLPAFKRRNPGAILADLRLLFPDWFKRGSKRVVMVCPVSVVDGVNLECPIIFATWCLLVKNWKAQETSLGKARDAYDSKYDDSFIDVIHYFLSDVFGGTYKPEVDRLDRQRDTVREQLAAIEEKLSPLMRAVKPLIVFKDGVEMSDEEKDSMYAL